MKRKETYKGALKEVKILIVKERTKYDQGKEYLLAADCTRRIIINHNATLVTTTAI